jgi:hypothetical protein
VSFSYHRSLGPTLGVLLGLAVCEAAVVHVVAVAIWGWPVALPLAAIGLGLIAAIAWLLLSLKRLPVVIGAETLVMRAGGLRSIEVPLAQVAGLAEAWTAADLKRRDVLNLALVAYPNVMVALREPARGRRGPIATIAHRLDDPAGFAAALALRTA